MTQASTQAPTQARMSLEALPDSPVLLRFKLGLRFGLGSQIQRLMLKSEGESFEFRVSSFELGIVDVVCVRRRASIGLGLRLGTGLGLEFVQGHLPQSSAQIGLSSVTEFQ